MVSCLYKNCLSKAEHEAIDAAVKNAEKKTRAEVVAIHARSSGHYHLFKLIYGLAFGTVAAFLTYFYFPNLYFTNFFMVQLVITAILSFLPISSWLIPEKVLQDTAANALFKEYYILDRNTPIDLPFALFYVSSFERYVHILVSDAVRAKINDDVWQEVIAKFTAQTKAEGLKNAMVAAIENIQEILKPNFPKKARKAK